ncbi:tRNA synthetase RNA-binding protein [Achromatium sp. WMS3]|nr:tRNA synthetase RNA-binding protein [Achromatium sp. WMS3]
MTKLTNQELSVMRLDKWLWAARFFKTRRMAVDAITGGKVQLNGQRSKPGKDVKLGDKLFIRKGILEWDIEVMGLNAQRRPTSEAVLLYQESDFSKTRRQEMLKSQKLAREIGMIPGGERPTKRDRRQINRFTVENG